MGISTSTGTLAAGTSRTFDLAPASAVTLTLPPNCRVTITESPATVAATSLGGNATRVHNPRLPGTFTYGPYPMGGSVLVENGSSSGSTVTWVETGAIYATDSNGNVTGLVGPGESDVVLDFGGDVYELPPVAVRITASQGIVGKACGLVSVNCVSATAITLTIYDNATVAAGTVLFAQAMSTGDSAVLPAKLKAVNGIWASFAGTATFDIGVHDAV